MLVRSPSPAVPSRAVASAPTRSTASAEVVSKVAKEPFAVAGPVALAWVTAVSHEPPSSAARIAWWAPT